MKFTTKIAGIAILALSTFNAWAGPIIDVDLVSSTNTLHTTQGSGGGVFKWQLNTDLSGTGFDWIDSEFYSMCIEPNEYLQSGKFELVDLALAPSSPGPMGAVKAAAIERIISGAGWLDFGELLADKEMLTAMSMLLWEAGSDPGNPISRSAGNFTIASNVLGAETKADLIQAFLADPQFKVDAYAMVGYKTDRHGNRVYSNKQDFVLYRVTQFETNVPTPAPLALMGLGLIGMIGARKFGKG